MTCGWYNIAYLEMMDNLAQSVGNSSQDIQKNRINIILNNTDKEEMKKKKYKNSQSERES